MSNTKHCSLAPKFQLVGFGFEQPDGEVQNKEKFSHYEKILTKRVLYVALGRTRIGRVQLAKEILATGLRFLVLLRKARHLMNPANGGEAGPTA